MSSVNLNVAARSGRPGQCEHLLQGADFTTLSNSHKIAKETIGAEVVWEVTYSESGKPTNFQDVLGKAQKCKSIVMQCYVTSQTHSTNILNKYWKGILEWKSLEEITGGLINGMVSV